MRWMFCCVWLACCSLDTHSLTNGTSASHDAPKGEWTPRDTNAVRTATAEAATSLSEDASEPTAAETDAGRHASVKDKPKASMKASAMDAGKPAASMMDAGMASRTLDAGMAPPMMVDAGMTSPPPRDAGASAPVSRPDATVADGGDAAQVDNILLWFALTGTRQQRVLMAALIADLDGTRAIDEDGMISVLRNFDELQCRRNVQLCWQVCEWATARCNVCEGRECQRLMFQQCGSDCRSPSPRP